MMFPQDEMELLRLRVGIGPKTRGQARWAVVMRREEDGYMSLLHIGEAFGTRTDCIREYAAKQSDGSKWPHSSGFKDNRKLTCERVVVAFNYREERHV